MLNEKSKHGTRHHPKTGGAERTSAVSTGLALVTGANDDNPSGVATRSIMAVHVPGVR